MSNEIKGVGNSYTAEFWEYDPRLGRRWNLDPRPNVSVSPYATFVNNPIFYMDPFGDTVRAVSKVSGVRLRDEIQNMFGGKDASELRNLFQLSNDGMTMATIDKEAFTNAISGLNENLQALATGYFDAINGTDIHNVEMITRSENNSPMANRLFGTKSGADVDRIAGGGVNASLSKNETYSLIVTNSFGAVSDYRSIHRYETRSSSAGELLAHEVLGHGVGRVKRSLNFEYGDAIQMTNLYLRSQGIFNVFRDGSSHGKKHNFATLSKASATKIPSYIQIPLIIRHSRFSMPPVKADKTYFRLFIPTEIN